MDGEKRKMKLRYVGPTFYAGGGLTNGKVYEVEIDSSGMFRVIDDSGEDYLYSPDKPGPLDGSTENGHWEKVE
jgi:hypothetical protein